MDKNIIFMVIQNYLEGEEWMNCNDYIKQLNTDEMRDSLLVGVVRMTYHYRGELSNWDDLFDRVGCELYRRGLDGESMLRGLYPCEEY